MIPFLHGLIWLIQSTGLLLLGLLAQRLARNRGPAVQTVIGRATLVAVALAVLLSGSPTVRVRPLWSISLPAAIPAPAPSQGEEKSTHIAPTASIPHAAKPDAPAISLNNSPLASALPNSLVTPLSRLYRALACLWSAVSFALFLWLGLCRWQLARLRRTARPLISGPTFDTLAGLTPHPPRLLAHPEVRSPFLAGVLRPAIYLPATSETDFDPNALRAILAHELEHIARRDCAWTVLSRILCALLWPQPLLWLLCRRLEEIGEEACDLAVLAQNCPPRAYADCLLTLAEHWPPSRRERALGAGVALFRSSMAEKSRRYWRQAHHLKP